MKRSDVGDVLTRCLSRYITRAGRETAEDATLLFGGRGITQTGMGKLVENVSLFRVGCYVMLNFTVYLQYHRTSPYDAILGGSEDVLGDLGVRQAIKKLPKNARL